MTITEITHEPMYCSNEFAENAVAVDDVIDGRPVVWLVDYESQLATCCNYYSYKVQAWKDFYPPTHEDYLEFLSRREPGTRYLRFLVKGLAKWQVEEAESGEEAYKKAKDFAGDREIFGLTEITEAQYRNIMISWEQ